MRQTQALAFLALLSVALSTPVANPEDSCTINVVKNPSFASDCTFSAETSTTTVLTNCGGCGLETKQLGLGVPCQTATTVPGIATETVTSCSGSGATSTPALPIITPSPTNPSGAPCTMWVMPSMNKFEKTCHSYPGTATVTSFTDCGNCVTSTVLMGPGPIIPPCETTLAEHASKTVKVGACRPTA